MGSLLIELARHSACDGGDHRSLQEFLLGSSLPRNDTCKKHGGESELTSVTT